MDRRRRRPGLDPGAAAFDCSHFPWQGLDPGMVGQAIVGHNTIVFWTVREGHGGNVTATADDQAIDFGAALPTLSWKASDPDTDWTTAPTCTTTANKRSPVGTYPITCSGAAADGYTIEYKDGVLTIAPAAQTIDFAPLTDQTIGNPPLALHAKASSGLPVAFSTTTPTVCTIDGKKLDKLTLVGLGACIVMADQAGDGNWLAAPQVSQTFTVSLPAATIEVTSDRATSVFGQAVKITATVSATAGKPTGTATFMDGTDVLATLALKGGKATFTSKTLAVGTHDISVVYGGSETYAGATGTLASGLTVTQAASQATITNAAELAKKATKVGVQYVVKVRIVAIAPGSGMPTGTVSVTDGTATCTATLAADGTTYCSFTRRR